MNDSRVNQAGPYGPGYGGCAAVASSRVSAVRRGSVCGALCLLLIAPSLIMPTEVKPDFDAADEAYSKRDILRIIEWYAKRNRLDPLLLRAVVKTESDFLHNARSHKGALGLMQLMPSTVAYYRVDDPFDPLQNIRAGARQLRRLLHRYHGNIPLALAAYNAGVHRVKGHRIPRIRETRRYVRKVLGHYDELQRHRPIQGPRLPRIASKRSSRPGPTRDAAGTAKRDGAARALPAVPETHTQPNPSGRG